MSLEQHVKEKFIPRLNKGKLHSIKIDPIRPADARGNYFVKVGLKQGGEVHEETFTETELAVIQSNYNWSETPHNARTNIGRIQSEVGLYNLRNYAKNTLGKIIDFFYKKKQKE
ncbi:hypothetical protein J4408_00725 [Candidatus Pacearchaeota archaeon]|nr:hypothetical protein [Candidatus Pacearchaeota archaeon]